MNRAGLALGSNLGDRVGLMKQARDLVRELCVEGEVFLQSGLYSTVPVGCPQGSGEYINAVVEIGWNGSPEDLLCQCQKIEENLGRARSGIIGEPRTIDVDVLYCGNAVVLADNLILPHPRMHQRKFVLKPLNDIRGQLVLPGHSLTVAEQLERLDDSEPDPVLHSREW